MPPRPFVLMEANHRQLQEARPRVAVLPWGATEAHNLHMPYGTDVIEASELATQSAALAHERGAAVIVLPTVPFGNDQQQLDQVCTINLSTPTVHALLSDVVRSLHRQGIDRLVILNAHGGNQFQPLVRDIQADYEMLIVVANFYQMVPQLRDELFDEPGDHADESETSILLHLCPDLVEMDSAGTGERIPFAIEALKQPGVWTPRPWSHCHPDTGSGDPSQATAEKGRQYFEALTNAVADVLVDLEKAKKGELPYIERS